MRNCEYASVGFWSRPVFQAWVVVVVIFFICVALVCGSIHFYYDNPADRALIEYLSKLVFGAAGLISVIIAGFAFHLANHRTMVGNAFEFLQKYDSAFVFELRELMETKVKPSEAIRTFELELISLAQSKYVFDTLAGEDEGLHKARRMLGLLEDIALSIATQHSHEPTLYRALSPGVVGMVRLLAPFIVCERHVKGSSLYYEDAYQLARSWDAGISVLSKGRIWGIWSNSHPK